MQELRSVSFRGRFRAVRKQEVRDAYLHEVLYEGLQGQGVLQGVLPKLLL